MKRNFAKNIIEELSQTIDVKINGDQPWDITIHNENFYDRIIKQGALGLGESYMEGWWDCPRLDIFFSRTLRANLDIKIKISLLLKIKFLLLKFINLQTKQRAGQVAEKHYNLGNQLFLSMLDPYMQYSCAYWKNTNNLQAAQLAKLELICQKLQLQPGDKVLDIGCGWGGFAKYAAEKYNVTVTGITISKEQYIYANDFCKNLPVTILLCDYRDMHEKFDKIVSIGMFEHVGHLNYHIYFKQVDHMLKDNGLFLLHTIGSNYTSPIINEWTTKYIFPNGMLPSIAQIAKVSEKKFVIEDLHNFGTYYDNTLMSWYDNFTQHWSNLSSLYDNEFYRMWTYYLLSSAGSFRARALQVWQVVFSKQGVIGGYTAPR
jgi:cyclopropane-fatty-acyl-phospholipid synthase